MSVGGGGGLKGRRVGEAEKEEEEDLLEAVYDDGGGDARASMEMAHFEIRHERDNCTDRCSPPPFVFHNGFTAFFVENLQFGRSPRRKCDRLPRLDGPLPAA